MKNKYVVISKELKHNHVYYSPKVDTIFLVTIRPCFKYSKNTTVSGDFFILEWEDANGIPEMQSFTYDEVESDGIMVMELGEL